MAALYSNVSDNIALTVLGGIGDSRPEEAAV
jgi:hypothetical protein